MVLGAAGTSSPARGEALKVTGQLDTPEFQERLGRLNTLLKSFTFATRLSAGGVADRVVTQMLRQGDAALLKLYSQAKLKMMREALTQLDRNANEHKEVFGIAKLN